MRRQISRYGLGLGFWLMLVVLSLLFLAGAGGTLWALGYFRPVPVNRDGQVAFPALARSVKAFEVISREDVINPESKQLNVVWFPESQASPSMLRDLGEIVGRVLARDKQPGYVLTEADFLPKGTRPGLTAGIPPGKRAVTILVERVPGLELLRQGDAFDLMAVLPPRKEALSNVEQAVLLGGVKPPDTRAGQLARQTGVKPLVVAGAMVALTQGKSQSTGGAQGLTVLAAGSRTSRGGPGVQATVAVDPDEVIPLTEALGSDVKLYCVGRSGRPSDAIEPAPQSLEGLVPVVATARTVHAYAALMQDDLADPVTGRLNLFYFPAERVRPDWLIDFGQLAGRVLAQDLPNGSIVTEADLLPAGTRPGIAAAAPPGTVVVSVSMSRIRGLSQLSRGDHVTIQARLASESRPAFPLTDWASLQGAVLHPEDRLLQDQLRTGIRTLVEDAIYLGPSPAEGQGDSLAHLAVPTAEAVQVSQALGQPDELIAIARAGKPQSERGSALTDGRAIRLASESRRTERDTGSEPPTDMLPFPVTAREVRAHEPLSIEDFIDPATGRPRILYFPKDRVRDDWIGSLDELIDRVTTQPVPRGRVIRTGNVLPPGARTGPTAGLLAGEAGLKVNSEEVHGLGGLSPGDTFQLIRAQPVNVEQLGGTIMPGIQGGDAFAQAESSGVATGHAIVEVLSARARLNEVGGKESHLIRRTDVVRESVTQTQLTPTGPVRISTDRTEPRTTETHVEATTYWLALPAADVSAVTRAIASGQRVVAVADPGLHQPGGPRSSSTAAGSSQAPRIVEHLRGTQRNREVWLAAPLGAQRPVIRPIAPE
jgi:Flp pilus assembly protein CpaB